jgi:hypothetical protein
MTKLILLMAGIVLSVVDVSAQSVRVTKGDTRAELRAIYARFLDATRLKDRAAIDEIMTDDYSQITSEGRLRTKPVRISETLNDPDGSVEALELRDFNVRIYGNAAVAVCKVWERYKYINGDIKYYDIWSTATFVRQKGKWRIAATHLSMSEAK